MAEKYIVIRRQDVRKYLSAQEQAALATLVKKMIDSRQAENKPADDKFFVLNMRDMYAVPAMEAYIQAAETDKQNVASSGVQDALRVARERRQHAILNILDPKPPT